MASISHTEVTHADKARAVMLKLFVPSAFIQLLILQVTQSFQQHVPNREQWEAQMGPLPATLKSTNDPSELSNVRLPLPVTRHIVVIHLMSCRAGSHVNDHNPSIYWLR